jgi:IS30 family transposase
MTSYNRLTYEERCHIYQLNKIGFTQSAIAKELNRAKSTISRELSRNQGLRGYRPKQANRLAQERQSLKPQLWCKMVGELEARILAELGKRWSPEQISGRLKQEGVMISHEAIYQAIWRNKRGGGTWYEHLRHRAKPYQKRRHGKGNRGIIKNRIGIDQRPKIVDLKSRLGDWEIDTVIGAQHQRAVVTIVDRKSKVTRIRKVENKTALLVTQATLAALAQDVVLTITSDNGKEFAYHEQISEGLNSEFYFAQPYHSWERGLNENTNGLIRQYLPKGSSFKEVSDHDIQEIEDQLNDRPRKSLNFKTPNEVMIETRLKEQVLH